nr:acyltransferase [Acidobacteriota bacterium]
ALSMFAPVPFAEPAWSIGVEEQFYLVWPLLLRRFRSFVTLAIIVIAAMLALRYGSLWMAQSNRADADALRVWNIVISYFYFTRIECMAIGGLFAWCVFHKKFLGMLHSRVTQGIACLLIAYLLLTESGKPMFSYVWPAVLFGVLIVNVSTNPRSLLRFPSKPFDFLGNLSFSIYMFHEVAIRLTLSLTNETVMLYAISIALTLVIATATYYGVERPFLRMKSRFAVVASGDDARSEDAVLPIRSRPLPAA